MLHRSLLVLALALATVALPRQASAWTDARPAGLVTEVAVDRDGGATVTLRVRWRILAGRLHQFDLVELPTDLNLLEASAVTAAGAPVEITARAPGPGRLEVNLGADQRGLRRGAVDVVLRYTTSLRAQGAIRLAGHDAVVEFSSVPWERGLEATELRITLPTSARRAQWLSDDTPGVDATTTTEISRDVVRALRRHLPSGTRWTARVAADPNLFPWLTARASRPHRVQVYQRHRVGPALALGVGLAVALSLAALGLARGAREPYAPLRGRLAALPLALVAAGSFLQALAVAGVPYALSLGTLALLAAVALRVPRPRPLSLASRTAPMHLVSEKELLARTPPRPRSLVVGAAALASLAVGLGVLATRLHSFTLGIAALDLGLVSLALLALRHDSGAPYDFQVLRPVARAVAGLVGRSRAARIAWRLRGSPAETGSVRARLVPRPGWRLARGVHSLEWAVALHQGTFGWRPTVLAVLRVRPGSPHERSLRLLATRAGSLATSPDGDLLAWSAELVGPDRDTALKALKKLLPELIVRSPEGAERSRHLGDLLVQGASP